MCARPWVIPGSARAKASTYSLCADPRATSRMIGTSGDPARRRRAPRNPASGQGRPDGRTRSKPGNDVEDRKRSRRFEAVGDVLAGKIGGESSDVHRKGKETHEQGPHLGRAGRPEQPAAAGGDPEKREERRPPPVDGVTHSWRQPVEVALDVQRQGERRSEVVPAPDEVRRPENGTPSARRRIACADAVPPGPAGGQGNEGHAQEDAVGAHQPEEERKQGQPKEPPPEAST